MGGLVSYGAYIPYHRLERGRIAGVLGSVLLLAPNHPRHPEVDDQRRNRDQGHHPEGHDDQELALWRGMG